MTITLSNEYIALAQHQAAQAGFSNLAEYLEHLIDEAVSRKADRQQTLAAIREGLEDIKAGRTRPMTEALADIARKHNLPAPSGK